MTTATMTPIPASPTTSRPGDSEDITVFWRGRLTDWHTATSNGETVPVEVAEWAHMQRRACRIGTLSTEKSALLERTPGWSWEGF